MLGKRQGMLEVIKVLQKSRVLCTCDCGNQRILRIGHFNAGNASSCGCHWRVPSGMERGRMSYSNMMARCHNPKNKRFKDYGAAGITVCDEWRGNVRQFLEDMGPCPNGFQIDRIDNTKGYSKANCRWVSPKENMANRSVSVAYVVYGVRYKTCLEAASANGVSIATIGAWCKGRIAEGRYYPPRPNCYVEPVYRQAKEGRENAA